MAMYTPMPGVERFAPPRTVAPHVERAQRVLGGIVDAAVATAGGLGFVVLGGGRIPWPLTLEGFDDIGYVLALFTIGAVTTFCALGGALLLQRGQTFGKLIAGTRVVDANTGELPTAVQLALREVVRLGLPLVPWLGIVWLCANGLAIFGPERRCLHDRIAGTRVEPAV
jgi:uncharacterized RDD family membrane protein YckC